MLNTTYKHEIKAETNGYMNIIDANNLGLAAVKIGAGRNTKEEKIDHDSGIYLNKKMESQLKLGKH